MSFAVKSFLKALSDEFSLGIYDEMLMTLIIDYFQCNEFAQGDPHVSHKLFRDIDTQKVERLRVLKGRESFITCVNA